MFRGTDPKFHLRELMNTNVYNLNSYRHCLLFLFFVKLYKESLKSYEQFVNEMSTRSKRFFNVTCLEHFNLYYI